MRKHLGVSRCPKPQARCPIQRLIDTLPHSRVYARADQRLVAITSRNSPKTSVPPSLL